MAVHVYYPGASHPTVHPKGTRYNIIDGHLEVARWDPSILENVQVAMYAPGAWTAAVIVEASQDDEQDA